MKDNTLSLLDQINDESSERLDCLIAWSRINSYSDNLEGLSLMLSALKERFASLGGTMEIIALPPRLSISDQGEMIEIPNGKALRIIKRPDAQHRIFLAGHMDTVYSPSHPFQEVVKAASKKLIGPGVADMKGGLLVMLTALETLEKHPSSANIGWEVLINPDEEVGSVGSYPLFAEAAKRNAIGLIFEPSYPDGAIVSSRKGSCNFSVIARGRSAHAGRDFDKGRNAILALSQFVVKASSLTDSKKGIAVNAGYISGGGPVNIVPDLAVCGMNMRAVEKDDFHEMERTLPQIAQECEKEGLSLTMHLLSSRGPKPFDHASRSLFEQIEQSAKEEGITLSLRPSGGVCDGNILAEFGMPVIDTLGVVGGEIHTPNEYMEIDSLITRSRLAARFLINYASSADAKEKKR